MTHRRIIFFTCLSGISFHVLAKFYPSGSGGYSAAVFLLPFLLLPYILCLLLSLSRTPWLGLPGAVIALAGEVALGLAKAFAPAASIASLGPVLSTLSYLSVPLTISAAVLLASMRDSAQSPAPERARRGLVEAKAARGRESPWRPARVLGGATRPLQPAVQALASALPNF